MDIGKNDTKKAAQPPCDLAKQSLPARSPSGVKPVKAGEDTSGPGTGDRFGTFIEETYGTSCLQHYRELRAQHPKANSQDLLDGAIRLAFPDQVSFPSGFGQYRFNH